MKKYIITFSLFFNSFLFAWYVNGDTISIEDQSYPLDVCYGEYFNDVLMLSDFNGNLNGGDFNVILFRLTASWWGPSCAEVPAFDNLHSIFENDPIIIFENIDDLNQPYSCEEWGIFGEENIPILTTDPGDNEFFNLFANAYTWSVVLGPDMVVKFSQAGEVNSAIIQNILDEYENTGDINEDYSINIQDIIITISLILNNEYNSLADLNYDETIDVLDIVLLVDIILT